MLGLESFGVEDPGLDLDEPEVDLAEPDDEPEPRGAAAVEPEPERGAGATRGLDGDEVAGGAARGPERGVAGGAE